MGFLYIYIPYLAFSEPEPVATVHQEHDSVHGREVVLPHLEEHNPFKKTIWIIQYENNSEIKEACN